MSTTTIRLPDELKTRIAALAESTGLTAHAFIVAAIEAKTAEAEARAEFERVAQQRWLAVQRGGTAIPLDEARKYLQARAAGKKKAARPKARKVLSGVGRRVAQAADTNAA